MVFRSNFYFYFLLFVRFESFFPRVCELPNVGGGDRCDNKGGGTGNWNVRDIRHCGTLCGVVSVRLHLVLKPFPLTAFCVLSNFFCISNVVVSGCWLAGGQIKL